VTKTANRSLTIAAQAEAMERDLSVIRRAMRAPLDAEVARGELTTPQIAVMRVVVRQQGIRLKDLGREVSLAHSTVSGIVDRLEKRGLLERRADPEDGRTSRIFPAGEVTRFVRERIPQLSRGPLRAALERAGEAQRKNIGAALRRLRVLLETAKPEV
jgi:DNA-binding MarR family transcriptional regulator